MGSILGSKVTHDGKIIYSVCLDHDESLQLQGHIDDVHVFSSRVATVDTNVSAREKNSATQYFLIPRELRKELNYKNCSCQRLETKSKIVFVYLIDKFRL